MRIEESVTIEAPREAVWALLHDPVRYPALLDWVTAFDPREADCEPGVGARYEMRVAVGSADVGGEVEIIEYDACADIVWTSVTGIEQRGRLRLRSAGQDRTRLTMRISYGAPGALLGTLAELLSMPQVGTRVRRGLQNVKRVAEGADPPAGSGPSLVGRAVHEAENVLILARRGLVSPMRPDKLARLAIAGARWRGSLATAILAGAIRHPDRRMLIDELGELTYAEVDAQSNAAAFALRGAGLRAGDRVGLMGRDHRGFVLGAFAVAKLGCDLLLLNTSFSARQLSEVCEREDVAAILYDEEFAGLIEDAGRERLRVLAWHETDEGDAPRDPLLSRLIEEGDASPLSPPSRTGHVTILTSGTTGTPKGASRTSTPATLDPAAALLERIPQQEGQTVRIGAPLFHSWGLGNFALGLALGSTFVLRRKFDPEACLADIERYRCQTLVVVPVMLQRILALDEEVRHRYDTSSLRAVCASGSALSGELATRWMDEFGDNLYNMYGSTEVSVATLATPRDMRAAPGTAGRAARGTVVKLYDEHEREVLQGHTGRIFVGNAMLFEGYTGGGDKDRIGALMATGDVGRFDETGRLFVEGRDDEMIVSGGENVFPKEVEDVLAEHPAVAEAAAIGVEDENFGQRLRAFVTLRSGEDASEEELQDHVKANLARYKVPREVVFLDELPRNSTGKVLKRELVEDDGPDSGSGAGDEAAAEGAPTGMSAG
ncbi:MAG TPA: AMP-binding protein [Solirubrobacteraceae bacterium]|nr:AMP-binding protein [Solirubrobacteraceae bacterium]